MAALARRVVAMSDHRKGNEEFTLNGFAEIFSFVASQVHTSKNTYKRISEKAGVCPTTVSNMASGKTHYPRYSTVLGILDALGYEQVMRRR